MRKSMMVLISFVSFLALGTAGWAQVITGSQTRGQGTSGALQSTAVTLPKGGYIIKVENQGEGFWLESTTGIMQQYPVDATALAKLVPPGTWKAFPMLKAGQDRAGVTVTIGSSPPPKNDPCLIPDSFESIFDVAPQNQMAGPLLDYGSYYIYIAPAGSANSWQTWGWRRYGPFNLRGGIRYQIVHTGDLSQRGATATQMTTCQTDILFLNRSDVRVAFAVRLADNCVPPPPDDCSIPANFKDILDVAPLNQMPGPLLDAGSYYIDTAPTGCAGSWKKWGWRRYGPFNLRGGIRYQIVHSGDLSQRGATAMTMSSGQTDVLFLNRSDVRVSFAVRSAASCKLPSTVLSVSISPDHQTVKSGEKATTTATPVGGTPPYRHEWFDGSNRSNVTSATVTWTLRGAGTRDIKVIVTDSGSKTAEAHALVVIQAGISPPPPTPTVPPQTSTPSTTPSAGHWERGDAIITWDRPTSYEGGQAKKLAEQPYAGAHWLTADGWSNTIETIGSNHVVASAQAPPNFSYRYDLSWTEPPRILNAGQMVQFQIQVGDRGFVTLYEYEGDQTNNRNLVHGTGTMSAAPFKIPAVSAVNSDVSKAEFGFFVGAGGTPLKYVYTYHWVGGSAAASPAPAKQTYTGRFRNSKGETGSAKLMIEESNGTVHGEWDGDQFTGSRTGNVVTFEIRNVAGCRDYQVRVEFTGVEQAATVTYSVHDRCRQPASYSGTEQLTRQ